MSALYSMGFQGLQEGIKGSHTFRVSEGSQNCYGYSCYYYYYYDHYDYYYYCYYYYYYYYYNRERNNHPHPQL